MVVRNHEYVGVGVVKNPIGGAVEEEVAQS